MGGKGRHVLIAGGGVAALEAALALRALAEDRVQVELLAPEPRHWYRPLAVAEPFALGEVLHFELSSLTREMGASFSLGQLVSVDAARHLAYTSPGGVVPYATLLLACGARPINAVRGALTFRGPADTPTIEALLAEIAAGFARRVAFVVPTGAVWGLPAYELALMTAAWLDRHAIDAEVTLVTPETAPLQLFGREASAAVSAVLERSGVVFHGAAYATEARPGELLLVGDGIVVADRVVALPRLEGRRIGGISQTFEGFIPVDQHGRIAGVEDVYAAGDITAFPVKQGGIAAQQAEAAAESIAADAGAGLVPRPFRPVLRGLLLTGSEPRFLHTELGGSGTSWASPEPLWWPPSKIVGRYLSPFLAETTQTPVPAEPPSHTGVVVETAVEASTASRRDRLIGVAAKAAPHDSPVTPVGDLMFTELLTVAPEDTLGEVAERMLETDTRSALVTEYGKLIGIITARDMLHAVGGQVHPSQARARQWMTAEPISATVSTPRDTAAILMAEHHIGQLPVVDGEQLVGILRARDLIPTDTSHDETTAPIGLGL